MISLTYSLLEDRDKVGMHLHTVQWHLHRIQHHTPRKTFLLCCVYSAKVSEMIYCSLCCICLTVSSMMTVHSSGLKWQYSSTVCSGGSLTNGSASIVWHSPVSGWHVAA